MKKVVSVFFCFVVFFGLFAFSAGASAPILCPHCASSAKLVGSREEGMYIVYKYRCTNSACGHTFESKFLAGGGSTRGGGAGRRDPLPGYSSDGVPSVSISGKPTLAIPHSEIELDFYSGNVYPNSYCSHSGRTLNTNIAKHVCVISGNKLVSTSYPKSSLNFSSGYARYYFKAPVDGYYRVVPFTFSLLTTLEDGTSSSTSFSSGSSYSNYHYYAKGSSVSYSFSGRKSSSNVIHASYIGPAYISVEWYPADGVSGPIISNTTNITINNNTFDGNIYQDTKNNLTYIYPQYFTVDDSGNTITKIFENPIIYNSTTNQYYTYDSTTNNYYYITYVTATPEPTASPEPSATPDPSTGGTTPTPGGTSGGGSTNTPESGSSGSSGGQSWWSKLLDKLGNAVVDALLDAISTVLNLILKLFSTILGWIIWFASKSLDLLPFLPPGLSALLVGGVVVCFVIYIIKFIRG